MTEAEREQLVRDLGDVKRNADDLWRDLMRLFGHKGQSIARKVQKMRNDLVKIQERYKTPTSKKLTV